MCITLYPFHINYDRELRLRGYGSGYEQRRRGLHAASPHFLALFRIISRSKMNSCSFHFIRMAWPQLT